MKILYVVTKSDWGGAQKYVYDLATSFKSLGNEIAVSFGGRGGMYDRLLEHSDITLYPLESLQRDISLKKELYSLFELYRVFKDAKPDIVHLNSSKVAGLGALIGRMCGIKNIVVTIHGAPFREDRNLLSIFIIRSITWFSCMLAHKVIAVSQKDEFDLARLPFLRKKLKTIYLGLHYEAPVEKKKKTTRDTNIVTIAELHPNKGLLYAIPAIEELVKRGHHVTYTIIGEGMSRSDIERMIHLKSLGEHIKLLGHVHNAAHLLSEYDVFLLPSIKEGLPYVLLEAGKHMMPVVATITGGIPEIIMHNKTGLLVQPKDTNGLIAELERIITVKAEAKKMGQELHNHVVSTFSHSKMITQTAQVYGRGSVLHTK
jgi:glycosyltransferase involved in cell wall biosynthesis